MRELFSFLFATLVLTFAAAGAAQADDSVLSGGTSAVGKVNALYVRVAEQVFVQALREDLRAGREIWADVRFRNGAEAGREFALARIPHSVAIERGDLVEIRFAQAGRARHVVAPMPEVNRVVALTAKHHSVAALSYRTE